MDNNNPLALVLITIIILWVIGKLLARAQIKIEATSARSQIRGVKLGNQLHVSGLSDSNLQTLKSIILSRDIKMLSYFIAYYKPTFIKLEECISTLRTRFNAFLAKPLDNASEIEKIAAANRVLLADQPKRYNFSALNRAELRNLYEFDEKKQRQINYEFIAKFGGDHNFMDLFNLYVKLRSNANQVQYIPKTNELRNTVENLVNSGIAIQGRKIPLNERLSVLSISQLNEIAGELKITESYISKDEATDAIAKIPGSAILLAMIYNIDDLFLVRDEDIDEKAVDKEWSVYLTYAKLIFGTEYDSTSTSNSTLLANNLV